MTNRWLIAVLLSAWTFPTWALSHAVDELKGHMIAEKGDYRVIAIDPQDVQVAEDVLLSTDPGGIGKLTTFHGQTLRIERKSDGKRVFLITRGEDQRWRFEGRLTTQKVLSLIGRPDVVLGVASAAGVETMSPLESQANQMQKELDQMLISEQSDELLTQIHIAYMILQSDKKELWTADDYSNILSADSLLASQWSNFDYGDPTLSKQLRHTLMQLWQGQ